MKYRSDTVKETFKDADDAKVSMTVQEEGGYCGGVELIMHTRNGQDVTVVLTPADARRMAMTLAKVALLCEDC